MCANHKAWQNQKLDSNIVWGILHICSTRVCCLASFLALQALFRVFWKTDLRFETQITVFKRARLEPDEDPWYKTWKQPWVGAVASTGHQQSQPSVPDYIYKHTSYINFIHLYIHVTMQTSLYHLSCYSTGVGKCFHSSSSPNLWLPGWVNSCACIHSLIQQNYLYRKGHSHMMKLTYSIPFPCSTPFPTW